MIRRWLSSSSRALAIGAGAPSRIKTTMTRATPHHTASEAPRRCIDHSSPALRHCSILAAMSLGSVVVFPGPLVMPGGVVLGVAPLVRQPGLDAGGAALEEG